MRRRANKLDDKRVSNSPSNGNGWKRSLPGILVAPLRKWYFYLYFVQIGIDNILGVGTHGFEALFNIIALSALIGYFESACTMLWGRFVARIIGRDCILLNIPFILSLILNNILLIADSFVLINFGRVLDNGMLDIVAQANSRESGEFFSTYLNCWQLLLVVLILAVVNVCGLLLSRLSKRCSRISTAVAGVVVAWGVILSGVCVYKFARYRNAEGIPQLTSFTRVTYYAYILHNINAGIEQLADLAGKYSAGSHSVGGSLIFVIGESHSVFHSPLYGYDKDTAPLMSRYVADSSMVVFNDAVTVSDHTSGVMESLFSLGRYGEDIYTVAMFPMVFRHAGYHTSLYDNQYFVGQGQGFLITESVSESMFDRRNSKSYQYDGEMLDDIPEITEEKSLQIIHLLGQHYTYAERFPKTPEFTHFTENDYDGTYKERQTKADYDNACLYNDYVLNRIITANMDKNVCLVYVSDHGEDVYEQPGVVGHGNAAYIPTLRYQIRVPMLVWASRRFREENKELWQAVRDAADKPVITDDIPHLLMNLAGLDVPELDCTRSVINQQYDEAKPRIVLSSITYSSDK